MSFFSCSTVSPMLLSHFLTLAHPHPVMVITAASHPPPVLTVSSSYVKLLLFLLHYVIFLLLHRLSDVTFTFPNTSSPTSCYGHYTASHPPPVLTVSSSYVKLLLFLLHYVIFSCSTVSPMLLSHFLTLAHQHPVMVITQPHTLHLY